MSLPLYQIGLHRYRYRRGIGPSGFVRNRVAREECARIADLQTWFDDRIASGNSEAIIWYENTRRKPPRPDSGEPVNA